ncbi:hypothetical protein [Paludibacterium sp.]|uniref:hypothetical protein n=1 Tax=Paludibacterium sp. TaxID=1917523 RepID=UPI0025E75668|nr:hypothetical protein [Paludibacterium sp.]MBV8646876.1 hypothetical protein [Paludibacterium sp.]
MMSLWTRISRLAGALLFGAAMPLAHASTPAGVLDLLGITPSAESVDYVTHKKQYQLQTLLTEQSHPATRDLSTQIAADTLQGVNALLSVDLDVSHALQRIVRNPDQMQTLQNASRAMENALASGKKIYLYGTGASGRVALQVESALWRPFWQRARATAGGQKILSQFPDIDGAVVGDITGGDRALVSSLPSFEDLPLIGRLQWQQRAIRSGDVALAITEGGETPAVIGAIRAAADSVSLSGVHDRLFLYNNPNHVLLPLDRSRQVLRDARIDKINLTTGPQAIMGSTRMQAATIELYVVGVLLEDALQRFLAARLASEERASLGFSGALDLKQRLLRFVAVRRSVARAARQLARWSEREAQTYAAGRFSSYFAAQALLPVFTDLTERTPTFHLDPLDSVDLRARKSWAQVWTPVDTPQQAWRALLQRPFHGLDSAYFQAAFSQGIDDPVQRQTALASLKQAGDDQQYRYDFSFSQRNVERAGPNPGDLGVLVLLADESPSEHRFERWLKLFAQSKAHLQIVSVSPNSAPSFPGAQAVHVHIAESDPLRLNQQIALKMLINVHSSAVMAKLGRVVGNSMTDVVPGNWKLIGRATALIMLHVNHVLQSPAWIARHGRGRPISYAEANAVLFDAMSHAQGAQASEVARSIVRIVESLKRQRGVSWVEVNGMLKDTRLGDYLAPYRQAANQSPSGISRGMRSWIDATSPAAGSVTT